MMDRENSLLISVEEGRRVLGGISRGTMYDLCHRSDFPVVRIGRRLLISMPGLQAWLEQQAAGGKDEK